jgi:hypothetical protein
VAGYGVFSWVKGGVKRKAVVLKLGGFLGDIFLRAAPLHVYSPRRHNEHDG